LSRARTCLERPDRSRDIQSQLAKLKNQTSQLSSVLGEVQKCYGFPEVLASGDPSEPQPVPELVDAVIKIYQRCTKTHNDSLELSAKVVEIKTIKMPKWLHQTISSMSTSATSALDSEVIPSSMEKRMREIQSQFEEIRKEAMLVCAGLLW